MTKRPRLHTISAGFARFAQASVDVDELLRMIRRGRCPVTLVSMDFVWDDADRVIGDQLGVPREIVVWLDFDVMGFPLNIDLAAIAAVVFADWRAPGDTTPIVWTAPALEEAEAARIRAARRRGEFTVSA